MDEPNPETRQSLERVLAEHGAALARVATSYEADEALREDLLQDIALAVWRALPRLRDSSKLKAYVLRIAHNKSVNHVARQVREPAKADLGEPRSPIGSPESRFLHNERQARLMNAVRGLPIRYRQVISLVLEGMSYAEIGEILDISVSNVGVRVSRAREQLKESMAHE